MITYKAKIDQCRFQECIDQDSHHHVGTISANQLALNVGAWQAQCDLTKGRIIVRRTNPTSGATVTLRKPSKLRDGTLYLCQHDNGTFTASLDAVGIKSALLDRFAITDHDNQDPNHEYVGYYCQYARGDSNDYAYFRVVSDGKIEVELLDDSTYAFDPDDPESLTHYRGRIAYRVTDATWAVVCEAALDERGLLTGEHVTLHTRANNKYLLMLELDQYLTEHDCGNFADYIGEFKNAI